MRSLILATTTKSRPESVRISSFASHMDWGRLPADLEVHYPRGGHGMPRNRIVWVPDQSLCRIASRPLQRGCAIPGPMTIPHGQFRSESPLAISHCLPPTPPQPSTACSSAAFLEGLIPVIPAAPHVAGTVSPVSSHVSTPSRDLPAQVVSPAYPRPTQHEPGAGGGAGTVHLVTTRSPVFTTPESSSSTRL